VSLYSAKFKYHAFSTMIDKSHCHTEIIKIERVMIQRYIEQLKHNIISIRDIYIRKAVDYIYDHLEEDMSILDIAILIGFNSQNYFTTQYKKYTGLSPKGFREKKSDKYSIGIKNNIWLVL